MARALFVLAVLGACCLAVSATAQDAQNPFDGDFRIEADREGGFSPYISVRYTLRVQGGSATIAVSKKMPTAHGVQQRLGILPPDALEAARETLASCQPDALRNAPTLARSAETWTFATRLGAKDHSFKVTDPWRQRDGRYDACLQLLRTLAEAHAGHLPFRDIFVPADTLGFLQVDSIPKARVYVDGIDTGEESPIVRLVLPEGDHKVTFVNETMGLKRDYTVKILPDVTTNLDVDLR